CCNCACCTGCNGNICTCKLCFCAPFCTPAGRSSAFASPGPVTTMMAASAPQAEVQPAVSTLCGSLTPTLKVRSQRHSGKRRAHAQRSTRSARRATGARLMSKPTVVPTVRSFDISK
ncbi:unnamed protein product, partial [Symbiodinium pilosum]